jgi:hypothetical protein
VGFVLHFVGASVFCLGWIISQNISFSPQAPLGGVISVLALGFHWTLCANTHKKSQVFTESCRPKAMRSDILLEKLSENIQIQFAGLSSTNISQHIFASTEMVVFESAWGVVDENLKPVTLVRIVTLMIKHMTSKHMTWCHCLFLNLSSTSDICHLSNTYLYYFFLDVHTGHLVEEVFSIELNPNLHITNYLLISVFKTCLNLNLQ